MPIDPQIEHGAAQLGSAVEWRLLDVFENPRTARALEHLTCKRHEIRVGLQRRGFEWRICLARRTGPDEIEEAQVTGGGHELDRVSSEKSERIPRLWRNIDSEDGGIGPGLMQPHRGAACATEQVEHARWLSRHNHLYVGQAGSRSRQSHRSQ